MTLEALLRLPVSDIEQLSDDELERILAPMFPITRPRGSASILETLSASDDSLRAKIEEAKRASAANTLQF